MKLILFAVVPLILSIGVTPVLPFDFIPEADAVKAKGNSLTETNSKKVCGDRLCSELASKKSSILEDSENAPGTVVYQNGLYHLIEVSEGVYSFGNLIYLSLVIVTDEGAIVVDPNTVEHSEEMLQAVKAITYQPVKYLIYSHNHWDHSIGGQVFKDHGATVLSHVETRDWFLENPHPDVVVPDEIWEGSKKTIVLGGKTLELHQFGPSHGEGMTVFYLPDEKIIFVGDLVTPKTVGFGILGDFVPSEWERTLSEVEKLDFDIAMYSHKKPFGPAYEVTEQREYLKDLREEISSMIKDGVPPITIPSAIELPKYQDWGAYDQWLEMNAWRTLFEVWIGW